MAKKRMLWALSGILVFLFLSYPLLHIFNREVFWAGIPILFVYLHVIWILAIVGLYFLGKKSILRH